MNHLSSKLSGCSRILLIPCLVLLQTLAVLPLLASAGDLRVGGYQLVSQARVGRTTFDYTYRGTIENSGIVAYTGVSASLISTSPYTTVLDGSLTFDDTGIGARRVSTDTFKIRVDRLYPFSEAALNWTISAHQAAPSVTLETANQSNGVIGPAGGSIIAVASNGTKFTLSIAAGALSTPMAIAMTPIAHMAGLPLMGQVLAAVRLEPANVRFNVPATLIIEATAPFDTTPFLAGFIVQDDGSGYWLMSATLAGNRAIVPIAHFSTAGLMQDSAEEQIEKTLVPLIWAKYYGVGGVSDAARNVGTCSGPEFDELVKQVADMVLMGNVVPDLEVCGTVNSVNVCTTPQRLSFDAQELLANVMKTLFVKADNECKNNPSQEMEAMKCIAAAQNFHFLLTDDTLDTALMGMKGCGLSTLEIRPPGACLTINQAAALEAVALDLQGNRLLGRQLGWSSSNQAIAGVAASGDSALVTGRAKGETEVNVVDKMSGSLGIAKVDFNIVSAPIRVEQPVVTVLPAKAAVAVCSTKQLTATVTDCLGNPDTSCTPAWYSSNVDVAVVSPSGLVTPTGRGQANISAVCGDSTGVATITVKDFTGVWNDNYKETLRITVNGTNAQGSYSGYWDFCGGMIHGAIDGQVSGNGCVLTGTWVDNAAAEKIGDKPWRCFLWESGTFEFLLSSNGNSFDGSATFLCFDGECGDYGVKGPWNAIRRMAPGP